jgi:hypothetical protein
VKAVCPAVRWQDKQQPESVRVSLASVRAVTPFDWHVFARKRSYQGSNRCRASSLSTSASAAVAMSAISCGVASRYQ